MKNAVLKMLFSPIQIIGIFFGVLYTRHIRNCFVLIRQNFYTGLYKYQFNIIGKNSYILRLKSRLNLDNVSIGSNTFIEEDSQIRCFKTDKGIGKIFIGDNVNIGLYANISACNMIVISDGVLIGRNVMINDNSHGYTNRRQDIFMKPIDRPIVSKGIIKINKNVWIGENVTILGNVEIGENSIIGANSVVTRNISPYTVVGGVPAKTIKQL